MGTEITSTEMEFAAGAVAIGAVCGIGAVLLFFPIIDRFIRPRFQMERGAALLILLLTGLFFAIGGGCVSYLLLRNNARFGENLSETEASSWSILDDSCSFRDFS